MEIAMLNAKIIFLILVKKFYIPFECLSLTGHKEPPFFYFIFFYQRVYLVPLAKGTSLYKEIWLWNAQKKLTLKSQYWILSKPTLSS